MERPTDEPTDDPRVQRRVEVLSHLRDGAIDLDVAATVLGVSTRQVRRLLATITSRQRLDLVWREQFQQLLDQERRSGGFVF